MILLIPIPDLSVLMPADTTITRQRLFLFLHGKLDELRVNSGTPRHDSMSKKMPPCRRRGRRAGVKEVPS